MTTTTKAPQQGGAKASEAKPTTKNSKLVALLERTKGATLAEIIDATSWQPHSARAALTGLKNKGHEIIKSKRGEITCYHIKAKAS